MLPKRLGVKYFVDPSVEVDLAKYVPIYQRWIQREWVEGLLIDVANYDHVYHGPGVILIGDEADYAMDMREGRPGLLYTRKRQLMDTLAQELDRDARLALIAVQKLLGEPTLQGISFDLSEVQLYFFDRLALPNTPDTFSALTSELQAFADRVYPGAQVALESVSSDTREPFTVRLKANGTFDVETLLANIDSTEAIAE
ncbi:MAG: hypothetical protein CL610_08765 [Anaerolineaceae bacterium]|nr:hypothetical protein [Anaerolineaceae bacterium]